MNHTERFVHKCRGGVALGCAVLAVVLAAGSATALQAKPDGSRAPVVHKIALIDSAGYPISRDDFSPNPMSTRMTCGRCHNYGRISHGTHFGAGMETADQQASEPWILADELTGTQLPIGHEGWEPAKIGLSPWRFVKEFGSHMPGGGVGDIDHKSPDIISQWQLSGKLEINCLACHAGSPQQDQSEWAVQVANENFAWAATAASGIGTVTGAVANLPDDYALVNGPNLDDPEHSTPSIELNKSLFDSKNNVFIDITGKPSSDRCYFCHSSYVNGTEPWHTDQDVHMAAGLTCVDCHRNGIDHKISIEHDGDIQAGSLSCKGCHLGPDDADHGGRFGAPRPKHKGLPPTHLENLTCTACHSGPQLGEKPVQVLTSRANRLGAERKTKDYSNVPYIEEPVFVRNEYGKIAPSRVLWPAFWAKVDGDKITPVLPEKVETVAGDILETEQPVYRILTDLTAGLSLLRQNETETGRAVLVTDGKIYYRAPNTSLNFSKYSGNLTVKGAMWAEEKDGEVKPLVPAFDQNVDQIDETAESRILAMLKALGADQTAGESKPVFLYRDKMYSRSQGGYLDAGPRPGGENKSAEWGWLRDGTVEPLVPDFVIRSVDQIAGRRESFDEEQVEMTLKALADTEKEQSGKPSEFAYVAAGKMFRLNDSGKLDASDNDVANPVFWPISHDVRPVSQALGASGCTDCHTADSSFFFGTVEAAGPLRTQQVASVVPYKLQKLDRNYMRLFGWSFTYRPLLKIVGFCAAGLVLAVLILYGFVGLGAFCRWAGRKE